MSAFTNKINCQLASTAFSTVGPAVFLVLFSTWAKSMTLSAHEGKSVHDALADQLKVAAPFMGQLFKTLAAGETAAFVMRGIPLLMSAFTDKIQLDKSEKINVATSFIAQAGIWATIMLSAIPSKADSYIDKAAKDLHESDFQAVNMAFLVGFTFMVGNLWVETAMEACRPAANRSEAFATKQKLSIGMAALYLSVGVGMFATGAGSVPLLAAGMYAGALSTIFVIGVNAKAIWDGCSRKGPADRPVRPDTTGPESVHGTSLPGDAGYQDLEDADHPVTPSTENTHLLANTGGPQGGGAVVVEWGAPSATQPPQSAQSMAFAPKPDDTVVVVNPARRHSDADTEALALGNAQ